MEGSFYSEEKPKEKRIESECIMFIEQEGRITSSNKEDWGVIKELKKLPELQFVNYRL